MPASSAKFQIRSPQTPGYAVLISSTIGMTLDQSALLYDIEDIACEPQSWETSRAGLYCLLTMYQTNGPSPGSGLRTAEKLDTPVASTGHVLNEMTGQDHRFTEIRLVTWEKMGPLPDLSVG